MSETSLSDKKIFHGQLFQVILSQSMDIVPDEVNRHWKDNRRVMLRRYTKNQEKHDDSRPIRIMHYDNI